MSFFFINYHRFQDGKDNLAQSRPVSRILYPGYKPRTAAIPLGRGLLRASSGLTRGHRAGSPYRPPIWPCSGWGLPCLGRRRPSGEPYLAVSPLLPERKRSLSVALSVGSAPLDVIQHPALRSSDFPLKLSRGDSSSGRPDGFELPDYIIYEEFWEGIVRRLLFYRSLRSPGRRRGRFWRAGCGRCGIS